MLLEASADPNARNEYGDTPLHAAAGANLNPAAIEALLAAGADPNIQGQFNLTPLHVVMEDFDYWQNADSKVRDALRYERNERQGNWIGSDPSSRNKAVNALLDAGANPNMRMEYGWTPLHGAVGDNTNPAIIQALLEAGADPNTPSEDGSTPLHVAAADNANPAVIRALLKAGADPNAGHEHGDSPLHRAAESNRNPSIIRALGGRGRPQRPD